MTLNRKPLKGMRQLLPDEKRVENYLTGKLAEAGKAYGFEEYEAPILEPLELFTAKSGNELAVEQSYNFTDKSGRKLILRPELTPSLARMVSGAGELVFPVRWMSFPVCFRYERPQRGRAREFLQFNLDILGVDGMEADLELFLVLRRIMKSLGVGENLYTIRYSNRKLASAVLERIGLDEAQTAGAFSVMDKKDKMDPEAWRNWALGKLEGIPGARDVLEFASCTDLQSEWMKKVAGDTVEYSELLEFESMLRSAGIREARFEGSVVRGLDYYTGIVFELMDTGRENRRALCGGGRYENLVSMFGGGKISGVGFGLGLLTVRLFLETYGLIPQRVLEGHSADVFIAVYSGEQRAFALELAETLRDTGVYVEMDVTGKSISKQLGIANRKSVPFVVVIGPEEVESGKVTLKNMATGERLTCSPSEIPGLVGGRG